MRTPKKAPTMEQCTNRTKSNQNTKAKKKNHRPEAQFRHDLDTCSKSNDLPSALKLYQNALSSNIHLTSYHYNSLLHLCSSALETLDPSSKNPVIDSCFEIFGRMTSSGIIPTEATITTVARVASHRSEGGGDLAFELVKTMKEKYGAVPKLRTFGPAIFSYCNDLQADNAYEVEQLMVSMGVSPEEAEIAALFRVSAKTGKGEKVYEYLSKLRSTVGCVSSSTAEILEEWFTSEKAAEFGGEIWDIDRIKDAILMNGGGWHGLGWLGKGKWEVRRGSVRSNAECGCCSQRLACVDIEEKEAEKFAESVASLALERESKLNFKNFQEWLNRHANYEAIIDGANIALYKQNFADGGFSLSQLDIVVRELYKRNQCKWPLVILHNKRYQALIDNPANRQLLDTWRAEGALYMTPNGSNDDWYWLYAAVKLKCLLVTNDEMRDHIFELLGRSFFPKWKERHQVHYTFVNGDLRVSMPPPYSVVIQESVTGSWHVPLHKCNNERETMWLCICRSGLHGLHNGTVLSINGKRKERSPSPSKAIAH